MNKLRYLKGALLSSPLLLTSAFAFEQPAAEDLVGKVYAGAFLQHIKTDNDRLMTASPNSDIDHGSGYGGELGYRLTESTEFRLSYSDINLVKENPGFNEPNGSSAVIDALYFPTQKNFYLVGGINYLDIVSTEPSLDLGAGYRHYLSERAAIYIEGKGHYQFSENFQDASARVGFIYFFGGETKSSPAKAAPVTVIAPIVAIKDADKDGILDNTDECANTPITDKVDEQGCTIFTEEQSTIHLLVNFDNDKAIVKEAYLPEIEKMAEVLKTYPKTSLIIEGHTSKSGGAAYNKKISQQRADAIVNVLVNQFSVDASRLSAVGYGEERLIDLNDTQAASAKNRRIEAKVVATKQTAVKR